MAIAKHRNAPTECAWRHLNGVDAASSQVCCIGGGRSSHNVVARPTLNRNVEDGRDQNREGMDEKAGLPKPTPKTYTEHKNHGSVRGKQNDGQKPSKLARDACTHAASHAGRRCNPQAAQTAIGITLKPNRGEWVQAETSSSRIGSSRITSTEEVQRG